MIGIGPSRAGSDAAVQGTNDDAQISKMSCVRLGYFQDDLLQYFVRRGAVRRAPLINRGYYARAAALKQLLGQFLTVGEKGSTKQVLSLGAGFDTTWFHLKGEGLAPAKYFEIDFQEVVRKKASIIMSTKALRKLLGPDAASHSLSEEGGIVTESYSLLPADLRDMPALEASLLAAGLQPNLPTLIIAECVLVYMSPEASTALVSRLGQLLPTAAFVVYEQIKPYDAFGTQMMLNLQSRGCPLIGIHGSPDLDGQKKRFTKYNWQHALAWDMDTVYALHIDPQDKRRIERLEIFDEVEEWHLIQEHYCIAIGINDSRDLLHEFGLSTFPTPPGSVECLAQNERTLGQ